MIDEILPSKRLAGFGIQSNLTMGRGVKSEPKKAEKEDAT